MDEQMREKFEAWCREEGFEPSLWIEGKPEHGYAHARVMDYWAGWKACAASLSQSAAADESNALRIDHPLAQGQCVHGTAMSANCPACAKATP